MGTPTVTRQPAFQTVPHDQLALEGLLSKYSPVMYRAALRKLLNQADAEDAVQDALMSASKHFGQFKRECHISTWLVAIAINAARMQLRRARTAKAGRPAFRTATDALQFGGGPGLLRQERVLELGRAALSLDPFGLFDFRRRRRVEQASRALVLSTARQSAPAAR